MAETARGNVLLSQLSAHDLEVLASELHTVDLVAGDELYSPGAEIGQVYFPLSGLSSLVASSRAGAVDVGPVGFDGMIGLPAYLEAPTGPLSAQVHVSGQGLSIDVRAFRACIDQLREFDRVLRRYVQWTYSGMGVWVACARLHEIDERCSRWLLMAHDRVRADRFPLTHEYLAHMLGVRRPSVSLAAGVLQQAGLIRYARGVVTIRDRAGLELAACDCYATVTDEYTRIFGRSLRPA